MNTPLKTETYEIEVLVEMALAGKIRIPNFQRKFRWRYDDAVKLFDSIFKGYPLGNILFWSKEKSEEYPKQVVFGEISLEIEKEPSNIFLVVDGQQRLTTIVNCLTEQGYNAGWRIVYDFSDSKVKLGKSKLGQKQIPLYIIFDIPKIFSWLQENPDLIYLSAEISEKARLIRQFKIPASIVTTESETTLREIFDRLNNAGKRLTKSDVFHALHSGNVSDDSKNIILKLAEEIAAKTTFGLLDEGTIINCVMVLDKPDYSRDIHKDIEDSDSYKISTEYIIQAIHFLQNYCKVPHKEFLPYNYGLIVLTRFMKFHVIKDQQDIQSLTRWFWRNTLNGPTNGANSAEGRNLAKLIIESRGISDTINEFHAYETSKNKDADRQNYPSCFNFKSNSASGKALACIYYSMKPIEINDAEDYGSNQLLEISKDDISDYLSHEGRTLNALLPSIVSDKYSLGSDVRNSLGARYFTAIEGSINLENLKSVRDIDAILSRQVLDLSKLGNIDNEYVNSRNRQLDEMFAIEFRNLAGFSQNNRPITPIQKLEVE